MEKIINDQDKDKCHHIRNSFLSLHCGLILKCARTLLYSSPRLYCLLVPGSLTNPASFGCHNLNASTFLRAPLVFKWTGDIRDLLYLSHEMKYQNLHDSQPFHHRHVSNCCPLFLSTPVLSPRQPTFSGCRGKRLANIKIIPRSPLTTFCGR